MNRVVAQQVQLNLVSHNMSNHLCLVNHPHSIIRVSEPVFHKVSLAALIMHWVDKLQHDTDTAL